MRELLEEQRALGFPAFAGADAVIRIPLREGVVNALLRQFISGRGVAKGVTVQILANNRLGVDVSVDLPLIKQIHADCVLAPLTNFASDPRLLVMVTFPGLVGLAIKAFLPTVLDKLPKFVTFSNGRLFVDFKALLAGQNLGDLLPLIQSLAISSERGVLYLTLRLHINEEKAS